MLARMSTMVTHDDVTPPSAPQHQCINAACNCNDLVSAGACTEWCMANAVEAGAVATGKARATECRCGHDTCRMVAATPGTPQRGMS
jgi:hypothetical protein